MNSYFSRFGGLWIDSVDQAAVERRIAGVHDATLRSAIADFNRDGYVVLHGAIDPATVDAYLREYDVATRTPNRLLINTPGHSRPSQPFDRTASLLPGTKILDTGMILPTGPELCFAPRIDSFLFTLFEERMLAFQTLHFEMGSQQGIHQDTAYVVVDDEPMKVIASWIALEDIQPGTGELVYLIGGHRLPEYVYSAAHKHFDLNRDGTGQHDTHYRLLHEAAARAGLQQGRFLARKGDVLLWHADLPHGGSQVTETNRTRRSLVTHYCPASLTPHYFPHTVESRRRKIEVRGGNAMSSFYYEPDTFFQREPQIAVTNLYLALLKRQPSADELAAGIAALGSGTSFEALFHEIVSSPESKDFAAVPLRYPPGHPRSPIVDPRKLSAHLKSVYDKSAIDFAGIEVDLSAMAEFWSAHEEILRETPFLPQATPERRYHYGPGTYPLGDAAVLRLMMATHRPLRVIQIGLGISAASCVLDCAEEFALVPFGITCMDARPDRLRPLGNALTVLPQREVFGASAAFEELAAGDILLMETSHILKTGSDLCHALFEILPRLQPGVLVHLHSCQFPFEYPRRWLLEQNMSWNEVYAIRAFLMFNTRFKIRFWNSLFARHCTELAELSFPLLRSNPGSALWLEVVG